jgi:hypothetical protein
VLVGKHEGKIHWGDQDVDMSDDGLFISRTEIRRQSAMTESFI